MEKRNINYIEDLTFKEMIYAQEEAILKNNTKYLLNKLGVDYIGSI